MDSGRGRPYKGPVIALAALRWLFGSLVLQPLAWLLAVLAFLVGALLPWLSPFGGPQGSGEAPVLATWAFPAALAGSAAALGWLGTKSNFLTTLEPRTLWVVETGFLAGSALLAQGALAAGWCLLGGGGDPTPWLAGLLLQALHCAALGSLLGRLGLAPATAAVAQAAFVWSGARASAEAGWAAALLDVASHPMRSPSLLDHPAALAASAAPVASLLVLARLVRVPRRPGRPAGQAARCVPS